jgi:hypothetical protein
MLNTLCRRNASLAVPFLQDGSAATLPQVVRLIARYPFGRQADGKISSSTVEFLNGLTSEAGGAGLLFNPAARGSERRRASATALPRTQR